ncbi:MAG: hypothetical protein AAGH70_11600 [Pseudomonadota bacterium]
MRAAAAVIALLAVAGCAPPTLHPASLKPGEKVGEDRYEGDRDGAHIVYFAPTLSTNPKFIEERMVDFADHGVLIRSSWAGTGHAFMNADGSSLGHGHGDTYFFELMSAGWGQPLPDGDRDLLFAVYDAACVLPDEAGGSLENHLERYPEVKDRLNITMMSGGYYRMRVRCEFQSGLGTVRR